MAAEGREEKTLSSSPTADEQARFCFRGEQSSRFPTVLAPDIACKSSPCHVDMHVGAAFSTNLALTPTDFPLQIVVLIAL